MHAQINIFFHDPPCFVNSISPPQKRHPHQPNDIDRDSRRYIRRTQDWVEITPGGKPVCRCCQECCSSLVLCCGYVDLTSRMFGPLHISYTSYVAVLNKAVQTSASLAYQWNLHRNVSLKAYVYPCRRNYLSTRIIYYYGSVGSFNFTKIIAGILK